MEYSTYELPLTSMLFSRLYTIPALAMPILLIILLALYIWYAIRALRLLIRVRKLKSKRINVMRLLLRTSLLFALAVVILTAIPVVTLLPFINTYGYVIAKVDALKVYDSKNPSQLIMATSNRDRILSIIKSIHDTSLRSPSPSEWSTGARYTLRFYSNRKKIPETIYVVIHPKKSNNFALVYFNRKETGLFETLGPYENTTIATAIEDLLASKENFEQDARR